MAHDDVTLLREHGINPSAQRVAVARYVLHTGDHPSAERVFSRVRETFPQVSRATVYNTLNLFVQKGLLRSFVLTEGKVVFDSKVDDHHHFVDEDDGSIHDVAWEALSVSGLEKLEGLAIREHQVVLRGRRTPTP
ncbi:MAG: Fur family transcriptional regulator [Deltaproteobacteria bacterium]|nr:Fur family transcriptional regulator [Deltaproteobacteria bacterium]